MSRLDELPPDQRAALSLLLRQHKSYAEVAQLLGIDERAVHDRAHAAIAMIAPRRAREVSAERRLEIGDYLLSQQAGVAERLRTRTYLSGSEQARAWAGEVSAALAPLAGAELPEIPAAGGGAPPQPPQPPQPQQPRQPQRVQDLAGSPSAAGASATPAPVSAQSSSRLGGALVLGVIVAAIVVAIVLLTGGGSSKGKSTSTASTGTTSTAAKKAGPTVTARLALRSPDPTSKSVGVVDVLSEGGKRAFFIEAQHLPRTQRLLLRDLAVQLAHERAAAQQEPAGRRLAQARRRCAAPGQRGQLPRNAADARDGHAPDAPRACGPARSVQADGMTGSSLPGFMIPAGSSSAFTRAAPPRRRRRSPAPSTAHGRARRRDGG